MNSARELRVEMAAATAVTAPADAWRRIQEGVSRGDTVLLPDAGTRGTAPRQRTLRVAASAFLIVSVSVASATLYSRGAGWMERLGRFGQIGDAAELVEVLSPAAVETLPMVSGISARGQEGLMTITLREASADLRIRVRLVGGDLVNVTAKGAAAEATFTSAPGELGVSGPGAGEVDLEVPRTLRRTVLLVNGVTYLVIQAGEVRVLAPAADSSSGEYLLLVTR